ncbi:MAG: PEPxxWA-CTERM sorting domain-containing protein [Brevundimonas sp.]|nr:PEPxxWA-CTERM sorting domain-containing protein [Brevundimonas sp.]
MRRSTFALFATVAAAATMTVAAPASAATELLVNGGFEDIGSAIQQGWGGYTYGASYSLPLPGWTVDSGSVDIVTNDTAWSPAYEGTKALDINGFGPGSISQTFATVIGQLYRVSYAYSRNASGALDPATATISAPGGASVGISAANGAFGSPSNITWQTGSFTFLGDATTGTLQLSTDNAGAGGVFFDAVSVTAIIPEPTTWALMIGGFGMVGAVLRRRSKLVAA